MAFELIEAEARRRAVDGTLRPVFYKGKKVGAIREYSDVLLMFLLKGLKPDKYRESTRSDVFNVDLSQFSLKQLKAIEDGVPLAQVMTMKEEPAK